MKPLINIIALLPILLILIILLLNRHVLWVVEEISLFWLFEIQIPVISFTIIFFIWYIMLVYVYFRLSWVFVSYKNNKQASEIEKLKSKLYEERPLLVEDLKNEFANILESYDEKAWVNLEKYKKENEKVISNLAFEIKLLKEKIDKLK